MERKKEIQQLVNWDSTKDIFVPYLLPRSFIVLHIGTNVQVFEYKLQR